MSRSPWNRFTSSSKDRDPHFGHFMVCGNEVLESAQAEGALAEWLVAADASRHPGLSLALQIASGALGKLADKREIAYGVGSLAPFGVSRCAHHSRSVITSLHPSAVA